MKIAQIHYTGFGGLGAVVNTMVTAPGAQAHDWIMGYYGVAPLDPSHKAFCDEHTLGYATFRPGPGKPWSAWRQLAIWLDRERPDAVVCHSTTAIPPCAWYARRRNVPLIAVEHTSNDVKSRNKWAGSCAAMMLANRVLLLTSVYASLLKRRLGPCFRSGKVRIVPNGIDTDLFRRRDQAPCNGSLRAGMAARFSSSKRYDLLIDIAPEITPALSLAGDGETLPALRARADAQGTSRVSFDGLVRGPDMPAWYRDLDLYVHASDGETFSMSILQAMATGLPIIASDISGMDEIIGSNGRCGMLVPNNRDAWRNAIEKLSNDETLRTRMGQAARERAVEMFSSEAMLNAYLGIIAEVQGGAAAAGHLPARLG